ncbi:MAG: hypothetical protein HGA96_07370 [Desulfobulbaceae bacterium]|nr:hypothetical protein [Desulfobulbaceae bacterium]
MNPKSINIFFSALIFFMILIHGGCSPLLNRAAVKNDVQYLKKAISEGADVNSNQIGKLEPTPLIIATSLGHIDFVRELLNAGANPNFAQHQGWARGGGIGKTPLIASAQAGHYEIANLLLKAGANPNLTDAGNQSALAWAACNNHPDIIQLLIEFKGQLEIRDKKFGQTALFSAVNKQYEQVVETLLKGGASPNQTDSTGTFPLIVATYLQNKKLVGMLLDYGAYPSVITYGKGESSLHFAARGNNAEILKKLIRSGAKVDIKSHAGQTPLMVAVINNKINMVKELVANGADINIIETEHGTTPFMQASLQKNYDIAEYLLKIGANKDTPDNKGITSRQHAINTNDRRLLEITRFDQRNVAINNIELELNNEIDRYNLRKEEYLTSKGEYKKNEIIFLNSLNNEQLEQFSNYTETVASSTANTAKILLSFRELLSTLEDIKKEEYVHLYSEKQMLDFSDVLLVKMADNITERKNTIKSLKEDIESDNKKIAAEEKQAAESTRIIQAAIANQQQNNALRQEQNTLGMLAVLTAGINTFSSIEATKYNAQVDAYRQYSNQYENERRNRELVNSIKGVEDSITKARRGQY